MMNFDNPGFITVLLAILVGVRLAVYAVGRSLTRRQADAAVPMLAPDEAADVAVPVLTPLTPGAVPLPPEVETETEEASAPTPAATVAQHRFLAELLDSALIAVVLVFFLIRPFVLQAFYIPSGSMIPTLQEGDKLLATKYTYHVREPHRGEVVVFHAPPTALELLNQRYDAKRPVDYVKRVIGLPHDHIRIVANVGVFVNGQLLQEPYIRSIPEYDFPVSSAGDITINTAPEVYTELMPNIQGGELVVPDGYVFVLGDNRNQSHDSHIWGLLKRDRLIGKAQFIFWPIYRIGIVR